MNDRELMQQALDALNNSIGLVREDAYNAEELYGNYPTRQGKVGGLKVLADDHEKAITALRDKLAQPQRQWVGLTDEDKAGFWVADQMTIEEWDTLFNEIEAALKEKNT